MISETENPHEAKRVCPGYPARYAKSDPCRYFTQSPQCWFSRETAHIYYSTDGLHYTICD